MLLFVNVFCIFYSVVLSLRWFSRQASESRSVFLYLCAVAVVSAGWWQWQHQVSTTLAPSSGGAQPAAPPHRAVSSSLRHYCLFWELGMVVHKISWTLTSIRWEKYYEEDISKWNTLDYWRPYFFIIIVHTSSLKSHVKTGLDFPKNWWILAIIKPMVLLVIKALVQWLNEVSS